MQSIELKVKVKSLAVEARIIRKEERKQLAAGRWTLHKQKISESVSFYNRYKNLRDHRIGVLRTQSRASHIAHALIKGTPYEDIEKCKPCNPPDWHKVRTMLIKYGPWTVKQVDELIEQITKPAAA